MKNNTATAESGNHDGVANLPLQHNEEDVTTPMIVPESDNLDQEPEITASSYVSAGTKNSPDMQKVSEQSSDSAGHPIGFLNEEMKQWLSTNREDYEFYLLHALLHDQHHRSNLLSTQISPLDFWNEQYALVLSAMIKKSEIMTATGHEVPFPPSPESLRTYVEVAVLEEGSDRDLIEETIDLLRELQKPRYTDMHYCVRPYFYAWYSSVRAKRATRVINREILPDVRSILDNLNMELDAASNFDGFLASRKFDYDNEPEAPEPLLKFKGRGICTPGNIVNIQGPPKASKSALVGGILAANLQAYDWMPIDSLGFDAHRDDDFAVLHFDTEQSEADHHKQLRRAYSRARRKKGVDWLHSYRLTGIEPMVCWDKMQQALREAQRDHRGISLVIIDGVADFCNDPNDTEECFLLVRKLHALASDYRCGVITVLHQNPGSQAGKTRGHLGSQIERKAETLLRIEKDAKSGIFKAWADSARSCHIPKAEAWRIKWCDEKQMHVSIGDSDESASQDRPDKPAKFQEEVSKVFGNSETMSYTEMVDQITRVTGLAESTAKARIPTYSKQLLIEKTESGLYRVNRCQISQ